MRFGSRSEAGDLGGSDDGRVLWRWGFSAALLRLGRYDSAQRASSFRLATEIRTGRAGEIPDLLNVQ